MKSGVSLRFHEKFGYFFSWHWHNLAVFPTLIDQKSPFWRQNWPKSPTLRAKFRPFFATFLAKIWCFLTPSTFFIAFLCDNLTKNFQIQLFLKKIIWGTIEKDYLEIMSKEGVKICLAFYVIFEHFRRGTRNSLKKSKYFCKNFEILLKIGQFWLNGQKSPKFRWRFLLKSGRQLDPKNRPFGEKSPQLGTLQSGVNHDVILVCLFTIRYNRSA